MVQPNQLVPPLPSEMQKTVELYRGQTKLSLAITKEGTYQCFALIPPERFYELREALKNTSFYFVKVFKEAPTSVIISLSYQLEPKTGLPTVPIVFDLVDPRKIDYLRALALTKRIFVCPIPRLADEKARINLSKVVELEMSADVARQLESLLTKD